jgi:hypothetical protein
MDKVWPPPSEPVEGVKLVTASVYATVVAVVKLAVPNGATLSWTAADPAMLLAGTVQVNDVAE